MSAPALLPYAGIAARHNVICDMREDGVTISLPGNFASYIAGSEHLLVAVARAVIWCFRRLMKYPEPPRTVIELNRNELRIAERRGHKVSERKWPRHEVGELRANRYSRGLLVRVPGKENFDILVDCSKELVQWLGETLTEALQRTQPVARETSAH